MVRATGSAAIRRGNYTARTTGNKPTTTTTQEEKERYGGRVQQLRGNKEQIKEQLQTEISRLQTLRQRYLDKGTSGPSGRANRKRAREYRDRIKTLQSAQNNLTTENLQRTSWRARVYMAASGADDYDKAKRVAAYSYAERSDRSAKIRGEREQAQAIQEQSGLTKEEYNQLNPEAERALRKEYGRGTLRRAGTPPPTPALSASQQAFYERKRRESENEFYEERFAAAQELDRQGYRARDFFPRRTPPSLIGNPNITSLSLNTLTQPPAGRRKPLTKEQIRQRGFERRAELISQKQAAYFNSPGFQRIRTFGQYATNPSFAGKTGEILITGVLSAPFGVYGTVKYGFQKAKLAGEMNLAGIGRKDILRESLIGAPRRLEKGPFSFLPGGTKITPEGAATGLSIVGGTVLLGSGIKAARTGPPRTTGPTGKIVITGQGSSRTITSQNLVPTPRPNTIIKLTYGERTRGFFPKNVDTTIRLSNTGAVKTQAIISNTYTSVLQGGRSLVTRTRNGRLLSQARLTNRGAEGLAFTTTRSTTKSGIEQYKGRANQLVSRSSTVEEFDVRGSITGRPVRGIFDTETIGTTKFFGGPARGTLRENVFERSPSGQKRIVGQYAEESFIPIKLAPGERGESFPKVFSKSQQASGGLRISDTGEIFSRVTTRTRTAELSNIRIRTRTAQAGAGEAYRISSTGFARPLSLAKSRRGVRFVGGRRTGRLAPTEEILPEPVIVRVPKPGRQPGFRGGYRAIPSPRRAPIAIPLSIPVSDQRLIQKPRKDLRQGPIQLPVNTVIQTPIQEPFFDLRRGAITTPGFDTTTRTIPRTTPKTPPFTPFTPFTPFRPGPTPPPETPPPIIPFSIGIGGFSLSGRGRSYTSKRRFGYAPDLPSIDLRLFGKTKTPRGGFTGLEPRKLRI